MMLKHDVALLGHLDNGLGFYRFTYNGSDKAYVGVMGQKVQTITPAAVMRGSDGYLRVFYEKLGVKFQTCDRWVASGAHVPAGAPGRALMLARARLSTRHPRNASQPITEAEAHGRSA
jgi:hypothetical protein